MSAPLCEFLEWDSEFFGHRIFRLGVERLRPELVERVLDECQTESIECLYFLANAGGVVVSYYEWVQNKTSDTWTGADIDGRLRDAMWDAADRVSVVMAERGCSRRQAAYIEAATLLQRVYRLRGIFP